MPRYKGFNDGIFWRFQMRLLKKGSLLLTVVIAAVLLPAVLFAADVIAYIGEVQGDVIVTRSNPGEMEAKLGMFLEAGDTVKTESGSFTAIIFQDDGSRIKLGESAQITLNASRKQKKLDKKVNLKQGKLWAKVNKKRGTDFQVRTPTSVASVKGTKFVIEELEAGETWVWVLEDIVELANATGTVSLGAGEYGVATSDGIESGTITGDVPVEPGAHELIFYFGQPGTGMQRELYIEYEK